MYYVLALSFSDLNPIGLSSISELVNALLRGIVAVSIPLLILFYVYIGIRFLQATIEGNPEKLAGLKGWLLWSFVAVLIIVSAPALYALLENTVTSILG